MIVGGVVAFLSWLVMPPRQHGPHQTFNIETGQLEARTTNDRGRTYAGFGITLGSLLFIVGQLYHIDRD